MGLVNSPTFFYLSVLYFFPSSEAKLVLYPSRDRLVVLVDRERHTSTDLGNPVITLFSYSLPREVACSRYDVSPDPCVIGVMKEEKGRLYLFVLRGVLLYQAMSE